MEYLKENVFEKAFEIVTWASKRNHHFVQENEWEFYDAVLKYYEEFGELSEVVLVVSGKLPHKTLDEECTGEVADNINQIADILSFNNYFLVNYKELINPDMSFKNYFENFHKDFTLKYNNSFKEALFAIHKNYAKSKELIINESGEGIIIYFEDAMRQLMLLNYLLMSLENEDHQVSYDKFIISINTMIDFINKKWNKWKRVEEIRTQKA